MTLMVLSDVVRIPAEAKIQLPVQRKSVIRRARLLERLTAVPDDVPLVLLTAPAGYGKTTLLSQWAAADGWRFGWVTLDQGDNDLVRLIDHVALALDGMDALDRRQVLDSPALRALAAGDASPYLAALPYVLASPCLASDPGVLVVDDVHELVNVEAMDFIQALGAAVPPGFHVALGVRPSLHLGLARLRGEGCVEFGVDDLAFTEDETRQVLAGAGVACSDQEAARLVQRTGGSPAALHLSALLIGAELSDDLHLHLQTGDGTHPRPWPCGYGSSPSPHAMVSVCRLPSAVCRLQSTRLRGTITRTITREQFRSLPPPAIPERCRVLVCRWVSADWRAVRPGDGVR